MTKILAKTGAAMALALALNAPLHAQLLGGAVGGALGGPVNAAVGVSGALDGAGGVVRSTAGVANTVAAAADVAVRAPAVAVPNVNAVVVPAVPDLALRRRAILATGIAPVPYAQVPYYVERQYVVFQDELRGTGVRVRRQGQQIVLEMPSDVTFSFNKYNIQPRFYGVLDAVSRTLAKYPATYVDVNGHTDAIGSFSYNQVLSEKRADSVADFLAARAVNPARMHVQGFGKTEPVASNATIEGRAANRRVEIILTPYAA